MKSHETLKFAGLSLLAGAIIGTIIALISPAPFINGFWGSALIAAASVFLLLITWRWAGKGRALAWMLVLAYVLRLAAGISMYVLLPTYGYDEPTQNAGYVFFDAAQRDRQSWELSQAHQVIEAATGTEYVTDQYGGLLAFSAAAYSVFSPDAHRPLFIVLFAAFAGSIGIPFFFLTLRKRFGENPAQLAAWVFALYPNSLLLGAAQMREPFILGLTAIALWAVTQWKTAPRKVTIPTLLLSLLVMAWFSSRVAIPVAGVLAVWFWLEHYADALPDKWKKVSWIILIGAALIFAIYGWRWVASTSVFDTRMTEYN